ncbi:glycosyl transferase family 1 [Erythrobacter sp. SG61-1L]|nr:glycosyl transferase family 1 [Erythrobacter sp. SG61-1L]KPL69810.1 glycosyl transferase family 1 [Erythrobacter sp. SG61-1L]
MFLLAGAAAFAVSIPAFASTPTGTDILSEWNLVVLGDLVSSSEVEGRTFVGGDLSGNSSNYNISTIPASTNGTPGLTVVGDVNGGTKNLNNGSGAIVGGNVNSGFNLNGATQTVQVGGTISNTNVNQNTVTSGLSASDPAFTQNLQQDKSLIATSVTNLSYDLSTLSPNSDFSIQGNKGVFTAQPDADGVAVFNISSADLDAIGEIQFDLNGAQTAIVNVSGTNITLNDNFLGGTNNLGENVIWNFPDAENLTLTTAFGGSVLAPKADAHTYNYIQGSAVFGSLTQDGEMHVGTYNGGYQYEPPSSSSSGGSSSGGSSSGGTEVPEPGMLALFAAGLAALFFWRRRRVKAA